jgi:non-ribosomal peptide synthetase component F
VLTGLLRPDPVTGIFSPQQLGQPIPGTTVILLDESLNPVESDQVPGEICVAGPCLSAGYLDDVERTREKFIYIKHHAQLFYRTGDLGRWAHTGTGKRVVEFLGREDRTVKVRGFLVNLEQDVDQGIVQACPEVSAVYSLLLDSNFCAAFVTQKDIDPEEVLARWREVALPYTVPDHLFRLDAFPLSPNGKLDPNQLRDIVAARLQQRSACLTDMSLGLSLEELMVTWLQRELHLAASEVDLTRSCVALGVHSLAALNLSSACREKGYAVSVAEILTAPSLAQLLKQDRAPILRALSTNSSTIIAKAPATPLQHKFVLETRLEPSLNYAQHVVAYAAGDLPRIKAAWQQLVQIEPMFRAVFHEQGDHVIQEVMPVAEFIWQDVCSDPDSGFDLVATFAAQKTGVGARFLAVHGQDPREPTQVIWTVHRALLDGYSAALLFDKLDLILEGRPVEPSLPYTQAAVDLEQLQASLETPSRVFYEQQQQRVPNPRGELLLPEPDVEGKLTARNEDYTVPRRINLARLQDAAQQANVTPATLLHAAWSLVVSSYSNSDQVLFGIVLAGRDLPFPWASSIVGPLMNQLSYRCEIPRKALVVDFLLSVQADLREYTRFQPTDGPADPSPCATMLVVQPPGLKTAPTTIAPVQAAITHDATSVPLVVEVTASGDVRMIYRTDRFSSMAVREVGDMLLNLVTALSSDMQATVQQCLHHRLSPDIRQTLLERGNAHRPENQIRDEGETLSSLFRQVVRDHPQVTAVSKDQTRLTYRELAEAASRVAGVLEQLVRPGEVVAVLADRSINWIIGVWAVIIANAVYCPVDAAYSPSYQVDLIRRSTASLLLLPSSEHLAKRTPGSPRTIVTERVLLSQDPPILQWRPQSPADVAYICFTSGSTGVPKGVMCLHRGLVALQAVESVRLGSQPGRRIAQFLSPGFGGCVHEVFSALCYGGTLVLRKDDNDMLSHLHEVDTAIITPSVAAAMDAAHFPNLRQVWSPPTAAWVAIQPGSY